MNYVYLLVDNNYEKYARIFLRSLSRYSPDCTVLFNGYNIDGNVIRKAWPGRLQFYNVPKADYIDRIATVKIERLALMPFKDGDNVLVLDVDMLVQSDPFVMFGCNGDVIVTGRPVKFKHLINGGVWGFRYNETGRKFLDFHIEQVHKKDWKPYKKYLKKFRHYDLVNWSVGQDFLNTIYLHSLPFDCNIVKFGAEWNYCLHSGSSARYKSFEALAKSEHFKESKRKYEEALDNKEYKIIHFKSKMKFIMEQYAEDKGWL